MWLSCVVTLFLYNKQESVSKTTTATRLKTRTNMSSMCTQHMKQILKHTCRCLCCFLQHSLSNTQKFQRLRGITIAALKHTLGRKVAVAWSDWCCLMVMLLSKAAWCCLAITTAEAIPPNINFSKPSFIYGMSKVVVADTFVCSVYVFQKYRSFFEGALVAGTDSTVLGKAEEGWHLIRGLVPFPYLFFN